jgi:hypothetical protein
MKLACTALERVPLTRAKIINNLMQRFHQDLVFCRSPADDELTKGVYGNVSIVSLISWFIYCGPTRNDLVSGYLGPYN